MPGTRLRVVQSILAILLVSVAAVSWTTSRRAAFTCSTDVWTLPVDNVSPSLRVLLPDQGRDFVSMIAADIDADGDLDVITSDSNLDLVIWVNDGHGRLSRRAARQPSSLQPEPAAPSVQNRTNIPAASVQSDPPTIVVHAKALNHIVVHAGAVAGAYALIPPIPAVTTRTPRAPPSPLAI
jgi:hypothetical protein